MPRSHHRQDAGEPPRRLAARKGSGGQVTGSSADPLSGCSSSRLVRLRHCRQLRRSTVRGQVTPNRSDRPSRRSDSATIAAAAFILHPCAISSASSSFFVAFVPFVVNPPKVRQRVSALGGNHEEFDEHKDPVEPDASACWLMGLLLRYQTKDRQRFHCRMLAFWRKAATNDGGAAYAAPPSFEFPGSDLETRYLLTAKGRSFSLTSRTLMSP